MIPQETIEAITDAARIEEVVGDFVSLKRRGQNMIGLCPFHNEKTPSFTVSPAKGIYKCFGCGKAGNAIGFIMEHEHLSYPESLRYLAGKYGIEIKEDAPSDEEKALRDKRESLTHIHTFALRFFQENLWEKEEGKAIGLTYLKERDYREDTLRKFQVGYSPESWDALTARAMNEGYASEHLIESGLSIQKDQRLYDRFRNRIIFPIHNLTGSPVAFAGRILTQDAKRPKYVNSPETEIYHKSRILYGLYQARSAVVSQDECLLVEGYTDVLSLHQAGIENVVASSGTSLTVEQIRLIKRYTPNITILYDGDAAGLKASYRGIDLILEQGMNVRIVLFPEGEDPDSYARKNRVNVVRDFIRSQAVNFILFKAEMLKKEAGNDPVKKAAGIRDILNSIALVPDAIRRNLFIRECSQLIDIPEQTLMFEMNKILRQKRTSSPVPSPADTPTLSPPPFEIPQKLTMQRLPVEKELVRILLNYGELEFVLHITEDGQTEDIPVNTATYILHQIISNDLQLEDPTCAEIVVEYRKSLEKEKLPSLNTFINHKNAEVARLAIDAISQQHQLSQNWSRRRISVVNEADRLDDLVVTIVNRLKISLINQRMEQLSKQIQEEEDVEIQMARLQEHRDLEQLKVEIARLLGRSMMY